MTEPYFFIATGPPQFLFKKIKHMIIIETNNVLSHLSIFLIIVIIKKSGFMF